MKRSILLVLVALVAACSSPTAPAKHKPLSAQWIVPDGARATCSPDADGNYRDTYTGGSCTIRIR
jgi:hypothetical protein